MAGKDEISLIATGDIGPLRENSEELFELVKPYIKAADVAIAQLEKNLSERGTIQLNIPRSLARTYPRLAGVLADTGFDVVSFASNHTLAFSNDAFYDTLDNLAKAGLKVVGAGRNIQEARKPVIMDVKGTKIGFLAYCSVVPKGFEAWEDKPGLAPVRVNTAYEQEDWNPGSPAKVYTIPYADDMKAMVNDIKKLRSQVDVLVVSQHWGIHLIPGLIAGYQYEVGHAAIDAGADIIIGHHAHVLKGIEVYKGKVIFFSLCNFVMEHPQKLVKGHVIGDLHRQYGLKTDPEYTTYAFPIDAQKTGMVKCTIKDKKIARVGFIPAMINKNSQPEPLKATDPRGDKVLEYIKWANDTQGIETKFRRQDDEIVVVTD
jgi:poly-gamma-glutamate capsule biosynthesis protein CapA/YwtB (metallophosphatase superfamily)